MNEWYKQLFGESEGKDNKGLFPASCIFSTDLHSMGQFIQEGSMASAAPFISSSMLIPAAAMGSRPKAERTE